MPMKAERVLAIRQRLDKTQVEMAKEMGVSERTYQRWEKLGASDLAAKLLRKLEEEDRAMVAKSASRENIERLRAV